MTIFEMWAESFRDTDINLARIGIRSELPGTGWKPCDQRLPVYHVWFMEKRLIATENLQEAAQTYARCLSS